MLRMDMEAKAQLEQAHSLMLEAIDELNTHVARAITDYDKLDSLVLAAKQTTSYYPD
jgi:hypothetical protein